MPSLAELRDQALSNLNETQERRDHARALLSEVEGAVRKALGGRAKTFCFDARQWDTFLELRQAAEHGAWEVDHDALAKTLPGWAEFHEEYEAAAERREGLREPMLFADCVFVFGQRELDIDLVVRLLDAKAERFSVECYGESSTKGVEAEGVKAVVAQVCKDAGLSFG